MNISEHFIEAAKKFPKNIAIIHKKHSVTYKELHIKVLKTVNYFSSKGIKTGDRVLVFVPMSIELYQSILALFYMGATVVFLDEWVNKERMEMCCSIANCKAFISGRKLRLFSYLSRELRSIPIKVGVSESKEASVPRFFKPLDDNAALITFTTGSTGRPKAALRTHTFLNEQYIALLDYIHPKATDTEITTLPIVLLLNLGAGTTSVITQFKSKKPEITNYKKVIQDIKKYNVNRITASPFFVEQLGQYANKENIDISAIIEIFTGGAPVFPDIAQTIKKAFPKAEINVLFGSTEAEPISHCKADDILADRENLVSKGLIAGTPYPKMDVEIIKIKDGPIRVKTNEELQNLYCKQNETGEIIVSGKHVLTQYFNSEDAFVRNKIKVGETIWHRTGDAGFIDENNLLYLVGRANRLLEINGKKISPFIYEYQLKQIEGVEMGTVLESKKQINIIIEPKRKSNTKSISQKLLSCSLYFDNFIFVNKIPRDPRHHSKIDYEKLKEDIENAK